MFDRRAPAGHRVRRRHGARCAIREAVGRDARSRAGRSARHGWRWIHYQQIDEATEREHMRLAVAAITRADRRAAASGWYTGRDSPNTRRLVVEHGGFLYDADYYGDDLPFWTRVAKSDGEACRIWSCRTRSTPTTCASRRRRASTPATQFFDYLKDTFDVLYAKAIRTATTRRR